MCSHTKPSQWVLIKGLQPFFQDQEVTNEFKTLRNPINIPPSLKKKRGQREGGRKIKEKEKYQ